MEFNKNHKQIQQILIPRCTFCIVENSCDYLPESNTMQLRTDTKIINCNILPQFIDRQYDTELLLSSYIFSLHN